jgi:hypothetical protein
MKELNPASHIDPKIQEAMSQALLTAHASLRPIEPSVLAVAPPDHPAAVSPSLPSGPTSIVRQVLDLMPPPDVLKAVFVEPNLAKFDPQKPRHTTSDGSPPPSVPVVQNPGTQVAVDHYANFLQSQWPATKAMLEELTALVTTGETTSDAITTDEYGTLPMGRIQDTLRAIQRDLPSWIDPGVPPGTPSLTESLTTMDHLAQTFDAWMREGAPEPPPPAP